MADLLPVTVTASHLESAPGLYDAVDWTTDAVTRWLESGVVVRPSNHGFTDQFGVWGEDWCVDPGDIVEIKEGDRPDISSLAAFPAMTVWGFDQNHCGDLTPEARSEVRASAEHVLDLQEQNAVETTLAARMLTDAGTAVASADVAAAIANLESALAVTGTKGVIHAGAHLATPAFAARAILVSAGGFRTVLGHKVVFGGGYVAGLGDVLVATSPMLGWRSPAVVRDTIKHETNQYVAVAERSVVVGYEKAVKAAEIT